MKCNVTPKQFLNQNQTSKEEAMSKKLILGLLMVMAFCLVQIAPAMAADEAKAAPAAKTGKTEMGPKHKMGKPANMVAVCACGKVFHPDATTKFIEANGKEYACCSDKCHEMGMKDPVAAAKMADDNMAKLMAPPPPPTGK
jgi:hypothetical protein